MRFAVVCGCAAFTVALLPLAACDEDRRYDGGVYIDGRPPPRDTDPEPEDADARPDDADARSLDADLRPDDADGAICDEVDLPVIRVTPKVLIVLDRSNSMHDEGHWRPVRDAIIEITDRMERRIAFGLMAFPESEGRDACQGFLHGCVSPDEPLVNARPGNASEIEDALEGLDTCGGTPTAPTLRAAADYFIVFESPTRVPSATSSGNYVLLATDGAPNCNGDLDGASCRCTAPDFCDEYPLNCLDDLETYEAIDELTAMGVRLFVLGIQASIWSDVLHEMAWRGGTFHAYMAEEHDEILDALADITVGLSTCEVAVLEPGLHVDPELVNFYIDDQRVPPSTGDACGWGWTWADESHRRIVFCGPYCQMLRSGEVDTVRATFGCPNVY